MASPMALHTTTPEPLAVRRTVEEIRGMAISRRNTTNAGESRSTTRHLSMVKENAGSVEEPCTVAVTVLSANDRVDRLATYGRRPGLDQVKRIDRGSRQTRGDRLQKREKHRRKDKAMELLIRAVTAQR